MKKTFRFSALICVMMLLILSTVSTAFAVVEPTSPNSDVKVCDFADLLDDSEEALLEEQLTGIRNELNFDVVIVTTDGYSANDIVEYADLFYEEGGYGAGEGRDGCVFVLDMGDREYYISTAGLGIYALSDSVLEYMERDFLGLLSDGEYYAAFKNFADETGYYVNAAINEDSSQEGADDGSDDGSYYYPEPYKDYEASDEDRTINVADLGSALIIAIIAGFVVGRASSSKYKKKLISVRQRNEASEYVVPGSINLTGKTDRFMYSTIMAVPKPKDNDSGSHSQGPHFGGSHVHTSSGGMSHGGRGGHF